MSDDAPELFNEDEIAATIDGDFELIAERCSIQGLGRKDGVYHYLTRAGEHRALRFSDHSDNGIASLFDGDMRWLYENFPKKDSEGKPSGYKAAAARNFLMRLCAEAGLFAAHDLIRGPGVWPDDKGGLILHAGDEVLADGVWQGEHRRIGPHIYPLGERIPRPGPEACGADRIRALFHFLASWNWRHIDRACYSIVGWLAASQVVGVLGFRPNIWTTGPTTSGKSTLEDLIKRLLGGKGGYLDVSEPTEAAVRQHLGAAARAVIIDEIEPDELGRRARDVSQLVRVASRRGAPPIRRGTLHGQGLTFYIRACFYFSSINVPPLDPQDRNRIMILECEQLPGGKEARQALRDGLAEFADLGPGLRRRAIDQYARFEETFGVYEDVLAEQGHTGRQIDVVGTLLACHSLLLDNGSPSSAQARAQALLFPADQISGEGADADQGFACLTHLLTTSREREWSEAAKMHRPVTMGQLVLRQAGSGNRYISPLRAYGMTLKKDPETGDLMLVVANHHQGLEDIFQRTKWARGVWSQDLARLPGRKLVDLTVSFAGVKSKGVWIPLGLISDEPGDEDEGPPAAKPDEPDQQL